jgi:hypothetical protein
MMRETGRLLSLLVMLAGSAILTWLTFQTFGLIAAVIVGAFCLLITAATLRL